MGVLEWWLERGQPTYSAEDLGRWLLGLSSPRTSHEDEEPDEYVRPDRVLVLGASRGGTGARKGGAGSGKEPLPCKEHIRSAKKHRGRNPLTQQCSAGARGIAPARRGRDVLPRHRPGNPLRVRGGDAERGEDAADEEAGHALSQGERRAASSRAPASARRRRRGGSSSTRRPRWLDRMRRRRRSGTAKTTGTPRPSLAGPALRADGRRDCCSDGPGTLDTLEATDLGVVSGAFSAHPHRVASLRTTFNFGVRYGPKMLDATTRCPMREPPRSSARWKRPGRACCTTSSRP